MRRQQLYLRASLDGDPVAADVEDDRVADHVFLLTAKHDAEAAKRFFRRVLANGGNRMPRVINVDKNRAYPAAVDELKKEGTIRRGCKPRQCKYLNNIVEQDHRT